MSFYQNVFVEEFRGNWVLGDRHQSLTFICPPNTGRDKEFVVAWNDGPYDLSGTDSDGTTSANLYLTFAIDERFVNWSTISVDITASAASSASVTYSEIVETLNDDEKFSSFFTASINNNRLMIKQNFSANRMKFYINNGRAEETIGFNARAGVAELPTYFKRHTMAQRFNFDDSTNQLILLDTGTNVDSNIIDNAVDNKGNSKNFESTTVKEDYELLTGRSGLFEFTSGPGTVVASTETQIIYPAGAKAGDLAVKVVTRYDAASKIVERFELPYTLESGDLITPP